MDAERFDGFVQSVAAARSRRVALRVVAAGVIAAPLASIGRAATAGRAACRADGAKCKKRSPEQCCSGICTKKHGKAKCRPAPNAFGCTNVQNSCAGPDVECPGKPAGSSHLCFVDSEQTPFCASVLGKFVCHACRVEHAEQDCFGPGWVCVACPDCAEFGEITACILPGT